MTCSQCGSPLPPNSDVCTSCGTKQGQNLSGDEPTHVPLRLNDVLEGKWRLERKLGEGGMGSVYLAHELALDRKVAVKLLAQALIDDQELVQRFEREARITAGLEHPNIVPVYAVGLHDRRPFMVMKAIDGKTLSIVLREKGAIPAAEMLPIVGQLASGLDFIHARGFIHRDIKAGNIIVGPTGHATILDFGILRPSRNAEQLTRTGMVMGTPQYMSPEQALGIRDIDHRSDLYAFAVLIFECLTGSLPFDSDNDLQIIQMQAHGEPPDATERAPWIPHAVSDTLRKALAKRPDDRFQTAAELAAALDEAFAQTLGPEQFPLAPEPNAPRRSNPSLRIPSPLSGVAPQRTLAGTPPGVTAPAPETRAPNEPGTGELLAALKPRRLPIVTGVAVAIALVLGLVVWLRPREPSAADTQIAVKDPTAPDAGPLAAGVPLEDDAGTLALSTPAIPDAGADSAALSDSSEKRDASTTPVSVRPSRERRHAAAKGPGTLNVVTTHRGEPFWASVVVDGQSKGKTPVLLELAAGRHHVRLERVGFRPVDKRIKIASGRSAVLRIELAQ